MKFEPPLPTFPTFFCHFHPRFQPSLFHLINFRRSISNAKHLMNDYFDLCLIWMCICDEIIEFVQNLRLIAYICWYLNLFCGYMFIINLFNVFSNPFDFYISRSNPLTFVFCSCLMFLAISLYYLCESLFFQKGIMVTLIYTFAFNLITCL